MKIAITGCGIGGLAIANLLADTDHEITLYDQFDTPAPVGSGLVIQPVGLRVLEKMGAAEDALAYGAAGYQMLGHESHTGRKVLDVSYGPNGGNSFGLGIHRASLFEALLNASQRKGVSITTASRVTGTTLLNRKHTLDLTGKTAGPFDLVIDASGAKSPLSPMTAKPLPYGAIWGTVDWPETTSLSYSRLQQRYRRASNMIGILPIGTLPNDNSPKAALFWSMPRNDFTLWENTPIDEWRKGAIGLWSELAPFVEQIQSHSQMTHARYSHGTLRKPYSQGLVHIGDAAHRASPQLGQGANMALLDAYALAHCLKHYALEQALAEYHKSRKRHVKIYQAMSWMFTPMYQSDSRILPILRDWLLAPSSTVPPAPKILTSLVKGTMVSPHRGIDI
ncbi:FAD-dependent monooxygenase [Amylibacter sp. SFDW26]|uniref:FAD-dependent oxidoreductase n=1 Tax=Amylibacter sp. SFDW26 TaxID=2652722 RepID=UPI001261FAA3|nr:NAD(P)/FAD-dependent oxidoreductase [Amylibacter sp. SFDW26]KAB7610481.1 FAD-dependent monooxygenase [Amylibacter sp. SFDW26]